MDRLSPYCLFAIFDNMSLRDQLSLAEVFGNAEAALNEYLSGKYKNLTITDKSDGTVYLNDKGMKHFREDMDRLLPIICDTIERINLRFVSPLTYSIVEKRKYPLAYEFRFMHDPDCFLGDHDVEEMVEMFPNLRTFSPHGPFSGMHFWRWGAMEHLTLTHCSQLSYHHVKKMLQAMPLKTLKLDVFRSTMPYPGWLELNSISVLYLNCWEAHWLLDQRYKAKNLTELVIADTETIRNVYSVFNKLGKIRPKAQWSLRLGYMCCGMHRALERTAIAPKVAQISYANMVLCGEEVSSMLIFPNLREWELLHLSFTVPLEPLHRLLEAETMERISIENCYLTMEHVVINLDRIDAMRSSKITLNFCDNTFNAREATSLYFEGRCPKVTVTSTARKSELYDAFKLKLIGP